MYIPDGQIIHFADNSFGAYDPIGHFVTIVLPEGQYSPGWQASEHITIRPAIELKYPAEQFNGEEIDKFGQYVPGGQMSGLTPSPIGQ